MHIHVSLLSIVHGSTITHSYATYTNAFTYLHTSMYHAYFTHNLHGTCHRTLLISSSFLHAFLSIWDLVVNEDFPPPLVFGFVLIEFSCTQILRIRIDSGSPQFSACLCMCGNGFCLFWIFWGVALVVSHSFLVPPTPPPTSSCRTGWQSGTHISKRKQFVSHEKIFPTIPIFNRSLFLFSSSTPETHHEQSIQLPLSPSWMVCSTPSFLLTH